MKSKGEMVKVSSRWLCICWVASMVASAEGDDSRPTMMNTTIVTEMLGTVVFIMLRM